MGVHATRELIEIHHLRHYLFRRCTNWSRQVGSQASGMMLERYDSLCFSPVQPRIQKNEDDLGRCAPFRADSGCSFQCRVIRDFNRSQGRWGCDGADLVRCAFKAGKSPVCLSVGLWSPLISTRSDPDLGAKNIASAYGWDLY